VEVLIGYFVEPVGDGSVDLKMHVI
jgi:hypothetical protein